MILSLYRKWFTKKFRHALFRDLKCGQSYYYIGVKFRKEGESRAFCFQTNKIIPFHESMIVLHNN